MSMTVQNSAAVEAALIELQRQLEKRLRKLPKDAVSDLHDLCELLQQEEDESERAEIVKTMREIIFPESLKYEVSDESISVELAARERLDNYRRMVGQKIRKKREEMKWTQQELAARAGIPQSHVSRLECGKHAPTFVTMERIAAALNTTPSQLDADSSYSA